jgi:hypothetical protein
MLLALIGLSIWQLPYTYEILFWCAIIIAGGLGGILGYFIFPLTLAPLQFLFISPLGMMFKALTFGLIGSIISAFASFFLGIMCLFFIPRGEEAIMNIQSRRLTLALGRFQSFDELQKTFQQNTGIKPYKPSNNMETSRKSNDAIPINKIPEQSESNLQPASSNSTYTLSQTNLVDAPPESQDSNLTENKSDNNIRTKGNEKSGEKSTGDLNNNRRRYQKR